ncbi:hypothetical protein CI109_106348 [Kwoniella shandongensis]|uniref:Uncharacterized protein n=1 Tax=Kwoniella shandongensis TaxID=1734106 RepID=A0A5M6BMX6_9TREE|nr:uncharacterized protein CI109_007456 [Kwoniella shandongensis]KAA5524216.1 hypothetical protein CI109_007456 [Kwoniella shandongensis]
MPKQIPQLDPPGEDTPLPDPIAQVRQQQLDMVRFYTEWATNGDPSNWVDLEMYRVFQGWVQKKELLEVIDGILQKRLTLSYPYKHKALILTQLIPVSHLAPYAKLLKPFFDDPTSVHLILPYPPGMIHTLAQSLHTIAEPQAAKVEADKKSTEEKKKDEEEMYKWQVWNELYGRTNRADWRGLPKGPEWGYWLWSEIGPEDWWSRRESKS